MERECYEQCDACHDCLDKSYCHWDIEKKCGIVSDGRTKLLDEIAADLRQCFPNSFVNDYGEFIADKGSNTYFILNNCRDHEEVKCKVLEYLSRSAFKTEPYHRDMLNREFHEKMLSGINEFLGTHFSESDMERIYVPLGNGVNRELCLKFIRSDYDLNVLPNYREQ